MKEPRQDIFISHASADKQQYIYPLTQALSVQDVTFWLDDVEISTIAVGRSRRAKKLPRDLRDGPLDQQKQSGGKFTVCE